MKNLFKSAIMLTACALTMCLTTSCSNDDDNDSPATKTFNELIKEDYQLVKNKYSGVEVIFYEVDAIMNGYFNEMDEKQLKIEEFTSIFQAGDSVVKVNHDLTTGTREFEAKEDYWVECEEMHLEDIKVTFEEAVKIMKKSEEFQNMNTDIVVLRHPLEKKPLNAPLYTFGQYGGVDVKTGEIYTLDVSFNQAMAYDYDMVTAKYDDDYVVFYQVNANLNGYIDEMKPEDIYVTNYTARFEKLHDKAILVDRDFDKRKIHMRTDAPGWSECVRFDPYELYVSFEDAVEIFAESTEIADKDKHISVMTFRHILDPKFEHPMYIFGQVAGVDAVTGELIPLQ